jgi:hypothetical protein
MADDLFTSSEERRQMRSERIQIEYAGMSHRVGTKRIKTLRFYAVDPEGSQKTHVVKVRIPDYKVVSRLKKMNTEDKIKYAVSAGDIEVFCDCRDFLYRYKYIAYIGDYGIEAETRPPDITNPNLEGALCKHILSVFSQIDKFIPEIKADIAEYAKKDKKKLT